MEWNLRNSSSRPHAVVVRIENVDGRSIPLLRSVDAIEPVKPICELYGLDRNKSPVACLKAVRQTVIKEDWGCADGVAIGVFLDNIRINRSSLIDSNAEPLLFLFAVLVATPSGGSGAVRAIHGKGCCFEQRRAHSVAPVEELQELFTRDEHTAANLDGRNNTIPNACRDGARIDARDSRRIQSSECCCL